MSFRIGLQQPNCKCKQTHIRKVLASDSQLIQHPCFQHQRVEQKLGVQRVCLDLKIRDGLRILNAIFVTKSRKKVAKMGKNTEMVLLEKKYYAGISKAYLNTFIF